VKNGKESRGFWRRVKFQLFQRRSLRGSKVRKSRLEKINVLKVGNF